MTQVCKTCLIEKDFACFGRWSNYVSGYAPYCKPCIATKSRVFRKADPVRAKRIDQKSKKTNAIKIAEYKKAYSTKNKTILQLKRKANTGSTERQKNYMVGYRQTHKEKLNRDGLQYSNNKRKTNPAFRLTVILRNRIKNVIRNKTKQGSAVRDLGMCYKVLLVYLNLDCLYKYNEPYTGNESKYHIDHIKPLSSFNLECRNEFLIAVSWKNLQILTARENLVKGGKIV